MPEVLCFATVDIVVRLSYRRDAEMLVGEWSRTMDARCRIQLLGGLRVQQGGREITRFRTQKTGAMLGYLAFYHDRAHPRDVLIEHFWPEDDLDLARLKLRLALNSLRRQLEPPGIPAGTILAATRSSVQLNPLATTTDVAAFEAALDEVTRAGKEVERAQRLTQAIERYRGELLPGYYEDWITQERERLAGAYFGAMGQLLASLEQSREFPRALDYARRMVAADPLREESYCTLIRLLIAAGQPDGALRQYAKLEQLLDQEMGTKPSAEIRDLVRPLERSAAGRKGGEVDGRDYQPVRALSRTALPTMSDSPLLPRVPDASSEPFLPGTVTFLLTELEGTPAAPEQEGPPPATAEYMEALLRSLFHSHRGHEVQITGGVFQMAFGRASDALAAAIAGQRVLAARAPGAGVHPSERREPGWRVRMALHLGEIQPGEELQASPALRHATQLLLAAHPGQILLSEETAGLLRRELEPPTHLVDLGLYRLHDTLPPERLFQVADAEETLRACPPPAAAPAYQGSVPLQLTHFFGREAEIAQLEQLLVAPTRLVTLTGLAGTGKTRLAAAVAGRLMQPFHGAVWFVPLVALNDPRRIPDAMREAMRLPRSPNVEPLEQVVTALSGQRSLLAFDNFEHLLPEGASIVRMLLERVPTPRGGESPKQLLECESVQLFCDRAQAVRPDFQVTPSNAACVAALCVRLEGIPLALELAAARLRALTPAQMQVHLEQRFEFLASRRADVIPRHRSLRAALDWSYGLLSPELQRFFMRLCVFRGGWTLPAAQGVCDETRALDYLEQLRECSLLIVEEEGGNARYRFLETIREYGEEKLRAFG
jgi:predicted ATPase/DNA-binding SARP family transcriptional activator/class 3 adenylate cyclase